MDTPQNPTNQLELTEDDRKLLGLLSLKQEEWISYVAVGGLITGDDGSIKKMTISEFAIELGVDRSTLNEWKKTIPHFWDRVDKRRNELFSKNRITAVWNGLFLRAAKGDAEQAKIILGQYAQWQPPSQKHEVTIGGLGDLVGLARKKNIIEGDVVEPNT